MENQRILKEGELVQWYRIEKVLGRGGFGVTYLATDTNLDHKVAIKEYMPGWAVERLADNSLVPISDEVGEDFAVGLRSFLREARTLVKFRHPNIVRVMTVFEANNTAYLVMEYEEGEEFKSYVQRGAGMDEETLKSLILRIVDGLDQVHQCGFLHRDIKPVNLIIRKDGSPVLLDFGAARPTEGEVAHTAYVSAGYTPIEQYQEGDGMQVGPWTDIYSLGATLYYAITGKTPIGPTGRLAALVRKSPDPLESAKSVGAGRYSESFLEAIDWALTFRPADRPRDLPEWREALDSAAVLAQREEQRVLEAQRLASISLRNTAADEDRAATLRASYAQQRQENKIPVVRMAVAVGSLLAVAAGGVWFYDTSKKQSAFEALMSQASKEFDQESYVDGALPLYRQALATDSGNVVALSKLKQIEFIVNQRLNSQIQSGDLEQAALSLSELKKVSLSEKSASDAERRLQLALERQATDARFQQVQSLNDSGNYEQALSLLATLRTDLPDDSRTDELETIVQASLQENQASALQLSNQRAEQFRREAAANQRAADALTEQRQRRQNYDSYLSSAQQELSQGNIQSARSWLDDARSLQINDARLRELESQVVAQEEYQRKPLSEYEISYATGQFNALRRAVESKNQQAMTELTEGSLNRQGLFDTLFDRYTRLDAKIVDINTALDPKRVTAKLRIEAMVLPNGDIVYPSPAYRDSELLLKRERYGWSKIDW